MLFLSLFHSPLNFSLKLITPETNQSPHLLYQERKGLFSLAFCFVCLFVCLFVLDWAVFNLKNSLMNWHIFGILISKRVYQSRIINATQAAQDIKVRSFTFDLPRVHCKWRKIKKMHLHIARHHCSFGRVVSDSVLWKQGDDKRNAGWPCWALWISPVSGHWTKTSFSPAWRKGVSGQPSLLSDRCSAEWSNVNNRINICDVIKQNESEVCQIQFSIFLIDCIYNMLFA